jgi:HSP20 family molecular chaperone IbpA
MSDKPFDFKQFVKDIAENVETGGQLFKNGQIFSISAKDIKDFMTKVEEDIKREQIKEDNEKFKKHIDEINRKPAYKKFQGLNDLIDSTISNIKEDQKKQSPNDNDFTGVIDQIILDDLKKIADEYPLTEIRTDDGINKEILISVPGFSKNDIIVRVEGTQLKVQGFPSENSVRVTKDNSKVFIRPFTKLFSIKEFSKVEALYNNGFLGIFVFEPKVQDTAYNVEIK